MPKLQVIPTASGQHYGVQFICPACGGPMTLPTQHTPVEIHAPRWDWNGDLDAPVLSPSIKTHGARTADGEGWAANAICHSYIGCNGAAPGEITFLSDCTHALAGKTVPLPEIPQETLL
jgi:hypothetical protein